MVTCVPVLINGAMNGGGDFNLRQNKINFSASGMVNQNK